MAPESLINDELQGTTNEQGNGEDLDLSSNQPMLETSVGSGFLLSDPVTIGDLADQKQQRHRTVVIDVAVCRTIHFTEDNSQLCSFRLILHHSMMIWSETV